MDYSETEIRSAIVRLTKQLGGLEILIRLGNDDQENGRPRSPLTPTDPEQQRKDIEVAIYALGRLLRVKEIEYIFNTDAKARLKKRPDVTWIE